MQARPTLASGDFSGIDRRSWLAGILATCAWGSISSGEEPGKKADSKEDEEIALEEVRSAAAEAGLSPFKISKSPNYLAIGDASESFRAVTLRDCEGVAADYLDYYKAQGFDVHRPDRRLIVVTLADDRSFIAFVFPHSKMPINKPGPAPPIHGLYNRENNRLIVYDHRALGPQFGPRPAYQNIRTTAHEATHQLTFNTGLLKRKGDVPLCIVEGLAMYSEVRKTTGRTTPGENNTLRLSDLASQQRFKIPWVPVASLLAEDSHLRLPARESLLGYAEGWLLVDFLLKDKAKLPAFRAYLAAIRERKAPTFRVQDAEKHLGDLNVLNQELRAYAIRRMKI